MDKFDVGGIEVSARELVVAVRRGEREERLRSFPNTAEGHAAVVRFLAGGPERVRVVLESTGLYGLDLACALHRAAPRIEVMVANPRAVRHFASALMQRSKNDRLDAVVLREFAARMPFQPWSAPSPPAFALGALARRLETLTEQCTAEKNRLHATQLSAAIPLAVRRDLQRSVRSIERAIARLTREALRLLERDPLLGSSYRLLLTAKAQPVPCACWPRPRCSRKTSMCANGWPMLAWIRGNINRAVPCTRKCASARAATATCAALCTCPPWSPHVMSPTYAASINTCWPKENAKSRLWSP
jgi:hypothetical protein